MKGVVLAVGAAVGCGGPTSVPPPQFANVNGIYSFSATFDGFAAQQVSSNGTITLEQLDLDLAPLAGSANVNTRIPGPKCSRCDAAADCDGAQGFICERYADGINRCGDPTRPLDTCPSGNPTVDARPSVTTVLTGASMADGNRISFRLGSQGITWQFDGTVTADGRSMSGTHMLGAGTSSPIAGRWVASR